MYVFRSLSAKKKKKSKDYSTSKKRQNSVYGFIS